MHAISGSQLYSPIGTPRTASAQLGLDRVSQLPAIFVRFPVSKFILLGCASGDTPADYGMLVAAYRQS